ncbi:MAG: succinate dehydrogenase, cytochrome b556 subunit [Chloroflexi bacterium]|nr:succinate dehydrogenase, cytochrome b556 subunit [Chloroflexota bacterium]
MAVSNAPEGSRAYPGQQPREPQKRVLRWFQPFNRSLGTWSFTLNRVTGIGLVVYLYLHLGVLSLLLVGEESWDTFLAVAKSPPVLVMDVVLLAGLLIHGFNGLRVALVGSGFMVKQQRQLFIGMMVLALILLVIGGTAVFLK